MSEGRMVWLYNFRLHISAVEVYVIGNSDNWSISQKLVQTSNGIFEQKVALEEFERLEYAFHVDGTYVTDPSALLSPSITDGLTKNVLTREDCMQRGLVEPAVQKSSYNYKRLDFNNWEIRILFLDLRFNASIICNMKHVSLFNPGSYYALSYCWGNSRTKKKITVDGVIVDVTANLYSALTNVKGLLAGKSTNDSVALWVDAVCINQADAEERSSQVRNMFRIYSRAKEVIAFIGNPGNISCRNYYHSNSVAYLIEEQFIGQVGAELSPHYIWEKHGWEILNTFFNEPYWTRVWVIQEIAVALNITVLYGNVEIAWNDVATLLNLWKRSSELPIAIRAYQRALHLVKFRDRFLVVREPISLLDALSWSYNTQATDPRDKIFALLGLCYDGQIFVPLPNYKQPFNVIIMDMVKNMMTINRTLDLICLQGTIYSGNIIAGPSWLPKLFNMGPDISTLLESAIVERNFKGGQNPILEESNNGQHLRVRSLLLGSIRVISSAMKPHDRFDIPSPSMQEWVSWLDVLGREGSRILRLEHEIAFLDVLVKTLTMARLPKNMSNIMAIECFSLLWTPLGRGYIYDTELIRWIDANAQLKIGERALCEWSRIGRRSSQPFLDLTMYSAFVDTLREVIASGMRLICMEDDEVALVHPNSRVSDQIHYIQGCSSAVVLRDSALPGPIKQYHVVGGAFISDSDHFADFAVGARFTDKQMVTSWKIDLI